MSKNQIINLSSHEDNIEQLKEAFSIRKLDQKFLYFDKGAELFYREKKTDFLYGVFGIDDNILQQLDLPESFSKSDSIISLGCGDSHIEKFVLEYLSSIGISDIEYYGIDSSYSMIKSSLKNLENINSKTLICADLFSKSLKDELKKRLNNKKNKTYTMFGNIFGNLNPTQIISRLNNIMESGDNLWIDVRLKKGDTVGDDLKLFNHYCEYLKSKEQVALLSNVFWDFGIAKENFYLYVTTHHNRVLDSLRFDFRVNFLKKTKLNVFGDKFIILPDETMGIVSVYAYDYVKLINFFQEHGFKLKKMSRDDGRGHFIFTKD